MTGNLQRHESVRGVTLSGISFQHADWSEPDNRFLWWDPYRPASEWDSRGTCRHFVEINGADPRRDTGSMPQGAFNCPGAIQLEAASDCAVVNCEIAHVGFHAIAAWRACRNLRFEGNFLHELGAGGIICEGGELTEPEQQRTAYISIQDNHIHDVGVRGGLSDMGAIYLLGFQPGTYIRSNFIHDVNRAAYGGWGLYLDEGSSGITVENNLILRCATECVHQHFGRQNVFINNIFAYSNEGIFCLARDTRNACFDFPPQGTILMRNIFISRDQHMYTDLWASFRGPLPVTSDCNLYWDEVRRENATLLFEKTGAIPGPARQIK